jgi:hypothetical protein
MVLRLHLEWPRRQVLVVKWIAAQRAQSSQVEGAPTEALAEAEAHAVKAWKSIAQLS